MLKIRSIPCQQCNWQGTRKTETTPKVTKKICAVINKMKKKKTEKSVKPKDFLATDAHMYVSTIKKAL